MSFLGGGGNFSNRKPKPSGVDERKLSTNEQARPVPYFAGKQRIAVTFISQTFDIKRANVSVDVGKKPAHAGTSYYFSFAALIAHGPVDGIHAVILNNDTVWTGNLVRDASNPDFVDLTIEDYGLLRIYWGTETQTRDDYLYYTAGGFYGTAPEHPPYRGFCYLVAHQLFAGINQSNIQNLEFIVSRYPAFNGSPVAIGEDANPVNVLYELITNPRLGRGVDAGLLDAATLYSRGLDVAHEKIGISPVIDTQREALAWIKTLLEYIDGYTIISPAGLLSIGLARPLIDHSALPIVDESVMSEPLSLEPEDWSETFNETNVKFTSPAQNYGFEAKTWRDRGNFSVTGQLNTQTIEREWVTNPNLADFMAKAIGRIAALPEAKGTLRLRMTALFAQLTPGAMFKLNYPPRGYVGLVCRVIDRTVPDPSRPSYTVSFRIDRTYLLNGLYVVDPDLIFHAAAVAASIDNLRVVELPVALSPDGKPTLSVLAARPENTTAGYKVHLGKNYDAIAESYEQIDTHEQFAFRGNLLDSLTASEPLIDTTRGLQVLLTGPDTELPDVTMFDGLADELLAFVDDEIFSIAEAQIVGVDSYRLCVLRGRFGSKIQTHAIGAEVFIVRRSELQQLQHPLFAPTNIATLKIQSYTGQAESALEDETNFDVSIAGRVYTEPPLANLTVNGNGSNPSYSAGQSVAVAWSLTDGGELSHRSDLLKRLVVLEFYNAIGDTLLGTTSTPGGSLSLTNAQLQALLGGSEVSFMLEIKLRTISDWWEVESDEIRISVIKT